MSNATSTQTSSPAATQFPEVTLRPLVAADLDAVVQLDARIMGRSRRGYFERRLSAALRQPKRHLQFALTTPRGLAGFLLGRRAGGEYGRTEEVVVLEAVGVDPGARHSGLGQKLLAGLESWMKSHKLPRLVTQVDWRNLSMLKFLSSAQFALESRPILERLVDRMPLPATDEEIEQWPPVVRHLQKSDLDAIVRIDQRITGLDRRAYFQRKFDEVFDESAIMVSLVAEADGFPVAFAMARVDFGDFGHVEPSAALDTIGVDPAFARRGIGRAMMSQMIDNLAALHVERLETEVARDNFALQKFLFDFDFQASQRLSFQRPV